jgi:5-oxoprolinase (ATP-hydrolysing) subunit C
MTELIVASCGPYTSLQDAGRFGWQRFGVGPSGAMDLASLAIANALVGNEHKSAAIEFALAGGRFEVVGGDSRVALVGASAGLRIDGKPIPPLTSATACARQMIEILPGRKNVYSYLTVAGGFGVAPTLGSLSLHRRSGIGGLGGRALQAGDRLPLNLAAPQGPERTIASALQQSWTASIRVMLGPQNDHFANAGLATFLSEPFTISDQTDRMGMRLEGPKIAHASKGFNIVSDAIATGAIQVPGTGMPIILLADRQTTGGYPKIATVISADLPRLGQSRPGTLLRFQAVSRKEAVKAARDQAETLARVFASLTHVDLPALDSQRLLSLALVDGWIRAEL